MPHSVSESPSVVISIQYLCYLYDETKSGSSGNELRFSMFTKKNSSIDRLPPTLDALALRLHRVLIFFHQYLFDIFSELFSSFIKNYKITHRKKVSLHRSSHPEVFL